jgi:ubiquinone/menaquinone biosynthesis C-methylase UbiE
MTTATVLPATAANANPVRGRFNSWLFDTLSGQIDRQLHQVREELLGGLRGQVAEIGAGNGPTFRYLRGYDTLHAIEPNPYFHPRLRRAATAAGINLVLRPVSGEAIDLPDDSVDAVVSSWVLCTVDRPDQVIAEARRILKPGGRLVFVEHVRAEPGTTTRRAQDLLRRPWHWVFEGCHTNRDTADTLRQAGFSSLHLRPLQVRTAAVPIRTQVAGYAIK